MKRCVSVCCAALAFAVNAGEVVLDGTWTIVPQSGPDVCRGVAIGIGTAADVFADVLEEATGVRPKVVAADKAPSAPGRRIFIGGAFAERAGLMPAEFKRWDWGAAEKDGDLYFFGRDRGGSHPRFTNGCLIPSALAAVRFLETEVGVRFLMPGRIGREVPRTARLAVPAGFSRRGTVKAEFQGGRNFDFAYNMANNIFGAGTFHSYGGHTYPAACPRDKYAKDHPEYFARDANGKVIWADTWGHQAYCISNPGFRKIVYDEMLSRYDEGAEVCQLGQNDARAGLCRCAACHDLYGTGDDWSEKIWLFHREIAERLLKDRPGKLVHILSYGATAHPPKSFKVFPDNVLVEICDCREEAMRQWEGYTVPHGFTYYIYNWGWWPILGFTPKCSVAGLVEQMKRFHHYGLKGIYRCGFGEMFGMEGPAYWVYNHLVEEPDADVPALLSDYYRSAFGPAAEPMRRFYEDLEKPLSEVEGLYHVSVDDMVETTLRRSAKRDAISALATVYTPERVARMDAALAAAQQTAGLSAKQVRRLQLVRTEWNHVRNIGSIAWRYDRFRAHPTKAGCDGVLDLLRERNAMIERLFPDGRVRGIKDWPEIGLFGRPPLGAFRKNGHLRAVITVPLLWDVERMAKYRIVPGELMTPEERRAEMKKAGLSPLKGFRPLDAKLPGCTYEPYPDGTGFRFGQGTNGHVRVGLRVGAKDGLLPGKTYRIVWLARWENVNTAKSWQGFGFVATRDLKSAVGKDAATVREPAGSYHSGTSSGWVRESTVMTVCDREGFESDFAFRFWGARDGVAEVCDVTIEEVEP